MTTTALLVFARCLGMVFRAPGFSHPSVPSPVRVALALALAALVTPHARAASIADPAVFAIAIAAETLLGAAIGTGAALLYDAAYYAGRTIDDYVGIRSSVPSADVISAQAFGRLWSSAFLAAFFLLDGYVPVIGALTTSFDRVAPGVAIAGEAWTRYAIALPTTIVQGAVLIAAPALGVALTVQVALATVGRVVPRLASFSFAFPVVFAAVTLVTIVGIPLLAPLGARPWLVLPFEVAP